MNPVFLDTGYVIALEADDDQNHRAAQDHWQEFSRALPPLVTTSYVFSEVVTFFNHRKRHEKAASVGRTLLSSARVNLVHVEEALWRRGWNLFVSRPDKTYSLTDCISFLVMQDKDIETALAFDQHFVQAGFRKLPESP